jgi:hypothetical protein
VQAVAGPAPLNCNIKGGQRAELCRGESAHPVGHLFQQIPCLAIEAFDSFEQVGPAEDDCLPFGYVAKPLRVTPHG